MKVGRIVAGLGVGAITATVSTLPLEVPQNLTSHKVPLYISECSPARYRGKLLVLEMSIRCDRKSAASHPRQRLNITRASSYRTIRTTASSFMHPACKVATGSGGQLSEVYQ